ncbi:MAG: RagB/SusD family nutrient uptake outer membrane protein, partial [Longimicrobiales bacterium]
RVELYQGNWAQAEATARAVVSSGGYSLASSYADLFDANGAPTAEDIFRVAFTASDFYNLGYYYQFAGRFEIGATQDIYDAYPAGDERFDATFDGIRSDGIEVAKFPTTEGTENVHVIRYAEVLLILAEALAQQGGAAQLIEATDLLNELRDRAGLAPLLYGTQSATLDAIHQERRLELAFEGDRWFDLVRSGRAMTVLPGLQDYQQLWPIPLREEDVARLQQNPGY